MPKKTKTPTDNLFPPAEMAVLRIFVTQHNPKYPIPGWINSWPLETADMLRKPLKRLIAAARDEILHDHNSTRAESFRLRIHTPPEEITAAATARSKEFDNALYDFTTTFQVAMDALKSLPKYAEEDVHINFLKLFDPLDPLPSQFPNEEGKVAGAVGIAREEIKHKLLSAIARCVTPGSSRSA